MEWFGRSGLTIWNISVTSFTSLVESGRSFRTFVYHNAILYLLVRVVSIWIAQRIFRISGSVGLLHNTEKTSTALHSESYLWTYFKISPTLKSAQVSRGEISGLSDFEIKQIILAKYILLINYCSLWLLTDWLVIMAYNQPMPRA